MFKRRAGDEGGSTAEQVAELKGLIETAREERAALSTMLTQIELQGSKMSSLGRTLQEVSERAGGAAGKMDALTTRLSTLEARATGLEALEQRVEGLQGGVAKVEAIAQQLLSPDGELQRHRLEVQQLSSQATQNVALLDAMKAEQHSLDEVREGLRAAQQEVEAAARKTGALEGEFDRIRGLTSELTQDHGRLKEAIRESRDQATATTEAVREVEQKLGPLADVQELSRSTETRLASLNSMAEHVLQKVKVLENQKHTVEHAVIESNRLNEMVWNMDVQIAKLTDGARQAAEVEETVGRIETLATEAGSRLEEATRGQEAFAREVDKLERARVELAELVRSSAERLSVERRELDAYEQRVKALQGGLAATEERVDVLMQKEQELAGLDQRTVALEKRVEGLTGQTDELQERQADLDALRDRLSEVDDLSRRTGAQLETIAQRREELQGVQAEIDRVRTAHGEIGTMVEGLAADRKAFEAFLQRADEFRRQIPVLDSRMESITSKLSVVEEGTKTAASLAAAAEDLDRQMTRIGGHQQVVERIEERLKALGALTTGVDKRMEEQLARRAELDGLKSVCDGLAIQVTDARSQIDGIADTQQRLLPLSTRVTELASQVERTESAFRSAQQEETAIEAQEKRLGELLDRSRAVATEVEARLGQVQELTAELSSGGSMKDELVEELGRVQGRQREATAQVAQSEDQLTRLEQRLEGIDQRRSQVVFADKKLAAFEARLGELATLSDEVDRKTQVVETARAVVAAVKEEVAAVQQISARSKADLEHVVEHRAEVATLRARVEEALTGVGETEERMALIEKRRRVVDDVQRKTNVIVNVLEDVRVNLEMVSEQKAVIDHVVENVATLDETLRAAQATLKSLRIERELAERIERGIKSLRTKIGSVGTDDADEESQSA